MLKSISEIWAHTCVCWATGDKPTKRERLARNSHQPAVMRYVCVHAHLLLQRQSPRGTGWKVSHLAEGAHASHDNDHTREMRVSILVPSGLPVCRMTLKCTPECITFIRLTGYMGSDMGAGPIQLGERAPTMKCVEQEQTQLWWSLVAVSMTLSSTLARNLPRPADMGCVCARMCLRDKHRETTPTG